MEERKELIIVSVSKSDKEAHPITITRTPNIRYTPINLFLPFFV